MGNPSSRIRSFREFAEERKKTLVFTFGRFNPPSVGHEKLLNKVADIAKSKNNAPYRVYVSQTQDPKKNPLVYETKVKFMRKMFPTHARSIILSSAGELKTIMHIADSIAKDDFTHVVFVVGEDRVVGFQDLLNKYNGVERKDGFYSFKEITVVSAGERDPDSDDVVEGMSASKLRKFATENNLSEFSKGMPKGFGEVPELFKAVRAGMNLGESVKTPHVELSKKTDIREQYIRGEVFKIGDRVRTVSTNIPVIILERKTNHVVVSEGTARRTYFLKDLKY